MRAALLTAVFFLCLVAGTMHLLGGTDGKPLSPEAPKHEAVQAAGAREGERLEQVTLVEQRISTGRQTAHFVAERRKAAVRAAEERKRRRAAMERRTVTGTTQPRTGRCGGDLPPCWVMQRESGGNIHAYNPTGCYEKRTGHRGCKGKWQCSYSTCSGTGTEEQQDAEARRIWDNGNGCAHWDACGGPK